MFLTATILALPAVESKWAVSAHLGQTIAFLLAGVFLIRAFIARSKDAKGK